MFRAFFDALTKSDDWYNYWISSENYYRIAIYNVMLFIFGTYVPLLMQIASLIFGFSTLPS